MPYKFCPNGHKCGVRSYECSICNHEFKKKEIEKSGPQIFDTGGRGKRECKCGKFYSVLLDKCPSCNTEKEIIVKVNEWNDNYFESSKKWAEKFSLNGRIVYALGNYKVNKPSLNYNDFVVWVERILFSSKCVITKYAIKLLLNSFFSGPDLNLSYKLLDNFENETMA